MKTVFQKEVCEQLSCDLYETYPSWHCKLCKFNVQQQSIKTRIENVLKTLTDITKDVAELCKMRKDHKVSMHGESLFVFSNQKAIRMVMIE